MYFVFLMNFCERIYLERIYLKYAEVDKTELTQSWQDYEVGSEVDPVVDAVDEVALFHAHSSISSSISSVKSKGRQAQLQIHQRFKQSVKL